MSRPTITDVARVAQVSKATVSRVLSGNYEYMRGDTRERVEKAIDELGYRPSSVARSLTSKRTNTAALLVSDVGNPFYADVIHGVESVAFDSGYDVFLCNTNYDLDRGMAFIRSLIDKRVDGVLIMSSRMTSAWLDELARNAVPAVVLDWATQRERERLTTIRVDFDSGIRAAVDHLWTLGHRRFAHVSGPLEMPTSHLRRDAFLDALAERGVGPLAVAVVEGNLQMDGGRQAAKQLLAMPERPTALFAANDLTAIGVLNELRSRELAVPGQLSVIGLDDIWLAAQSDPPLTTVALPRYQIGEMAMQSLLTLLGAATPERIGTGEDHIVEAELVVRQSTAMAPDAPRE